MLEIAIIALLILANSLFALAEIAVVSSRVARLQELAEEGKRGAVGALKLAQDPSRFLSTVQIGISLISVFAGAFGGATLAKPLAGWLERASWLAPIADSLAFVLVVALITYFTLLIGELVPKRIALRDPERNAMRVAGFMNGLSRVAAPLVWLLGLSSDAVLKLLGVNPREPSAASEAEIILLLEQGRGAGIITDAEKEVIENVFRLDQRNAASIMTPRLEVGWLDLDDPPTAWLKAVESDGHPRLVVARGDLDDVVGVLSTRELLLAALDSNLTAEKLTELAAPPIVVPETANALHLFEDLNASRAQIAVVVDEYGGVAGVVSLHDLFGALLGQLLGADDTPLLAAQPDGSWLVDGNFRAAELEAQLKLKDLPKSGAGYETVAGMMAAALDRVPSEADSFEWERFSFEVVEMYGSRVVKVAARQLPAE